MDEDILVPLMFFLTVIVLALGGSLVWVLGKKWERDAKRSALPPDVASRLERMEQTIDAMAIEIERISEGQRFTTRLLADRMEPGRLPGGTETPAPPRSS